MNVLLTRGAEGLSRRGFSFDEILRMQEVGILDPDEKFEVIDGEIVPMNSQNMPHMMWKARLAKWLNLRLPDAIVLVPEGTLVLSERPANAFETDLLVFSPEPGALRIRPHMVKLAIEVADSSIGRDRDIKAPRYGKFGVGELWIVDVQARCTRVHRVPGETGYAEIVAHPFDAIIAPLFDPALAVRLAELER